MLYVCRLVEVRKLQTDIDDLIFADADAEPSEK